MTQFENRNLVSSDLDDNEYFTWTGNFSLNHLEALSKVFGKERIKNRIDRGQTPY